MVILWQDLWERQFEKILLKYGWEKVSNWECFFVHREKGLFLSVYVDDITIAGKKQNINPMWKVLNKEVDLGEPTSFLDHVYLGCTQRQCEISKSNGSRRENEGARRRAMLLLEVVEPVAFDAQIPLFLRFVCCARICGQCVWSPAAEPSGDVARPVLRKNERHDACTETGVRGSAVKRPVAGRSAAMSGNYLPSRASLPPLELLLASGPGSVDPHPGRLRTKKSERKSLVNLGVGEVRKKKMKPAPQSGEPLQYAGMVREENLQACSDLVRQEGERALPMVPSPSELREDRAWARTERSSEVRKSLRKRLSLGDPRSEKFTFKSPSQEAENAVATLVKSIRRRIKGRSTGSGSGISRGRENEDSLEHPLLAAPAWACQDVDIRARRFLGRFLANALRSMQRFLWPRVGADTTAEELSRVLTYLEAVFNQCYTKEWFWDPHSPGDAYTGRGHRLSPGRRQDEDVRLLDPAVQGGGDIRIRRVMDARTPPRVVSRGGFRADVAGRVGSHCTTRVGASTPGRRRRYQERIGSRQRHEFLDKRGCRAVSPSAPKVSPATSVVERGDFALPPTPEGHV